MQKKRTISLLLAIMMLFSLLPTSAFAAGSDESSGSTEKTREEVIENTSVQLMKDGAVRTDTFQQTETSVDVKVLLDETVQQCYMTVYAYIGTAGFDPDNSTSSFVLWKGQVKTGTVNCPFNPDVALKVGYKIIACVNTPAGKDAEGSPNYAYVKSQALEVVDEKGEGFRSYTYPDITIDETTLEPGATTLHISMTGDQRIFDAAAAGKIDINYTIGMYPADDEFQIEEGSTIALVQLGETREPITHQEVTLSQPLKAGWRVRAVAYWDGCPDLFIARSNDYQLGQADDSVLVSGTAEEDIPMAAIQGTPKAGDTSVTVTLGGKIPSGAVLILRSYDADATEFETSGGEWAATQTDAEAKTYVQNGQTVTCEFNQELPLYYNVIACLNVPVGEDFYRPSNSQALEVADDSGEGFRDYTYPDASIVETALEPGVNKLHIRLTGDERLFQAAKENKTSITVAVAQYPNDGTTFEFEGGKQISLASNLNFTEPQDSYEVTLAQPLKAGWRVRAVVYWRQNESIFLTKGNDYEAMFHRPDDSVLVSGTPEEDIPTATIQGTPKAGDTSVTVQLGGKIPDGTRVLLEKYDANTADEDCMLNGGTYLDGVDVSTAGEQTLTVSALTAGDKLVAFLTGSSGQLAKSQPVTVVAAQTTPLFTITPKGTLTADSTQITLTVSSSDASITNVGAFLCPVKNGSVDSDNWIVRKLGQSLGDITLNIPEGKLKDGDVVRLILNYEKNDDFPYYFGTEANNITVGAQVPAEDSVVLNESTFTTDATQATVTVTGCDSFRGGYLILTTGKTSTNGDADSRDQLGSVTFTGPGTYTVPFSNSRTKLTSGNTVQAHLYKYDVDADRTYYKYGNAVGITSGSPSAVKPEVSIATDGITADRTDIWVQTSFDGALTGTLKLYTYTGETFAADQAKEIYSGTISSSSNSQKITFGNGKLTAGQKLIAVLALSDGTSISSTAKTVQAAPEKIKPAVQFVTKKVTAGMMKLYASMTIDSSVNNASYTIYQFTGETLDVSAATALSSGTLYRSQAQETVPLGRDKLVPGAKLQIVLTADGVEARSDVLTVEPSPDWGTPYAAFNVSAVKTDAKSVSVHIDYADEYVAMGQDFYCDVTVYQFPGSYSDAEFESRELWENLTLIQRVSQINSNYGDTTRGTELTIPIKDSAKLNAGDRLIIKLRLPHTEWEGEEVDYLSASIPVVGENGTVPDAKVVLYNLGEDTSRGSRVRAILSGLNIPAETVTVEQMNETVGHLAGLDGYKDKAAREKYTGTAPDTEFMLLCNLPEALLDKFLDAMQADGLRIDHKAVVTAYNQDMELHELMGDISEEHDVFQMLLTLNNMVTDSEKLTEEAYGSSEHWNAFQEALSASDALLRSEEPTYEAMKAAYDALKAEYLAVTNLREIAGEAAITISEEDGGTYTMTATVEEGLADASYQYTWSNGQTTQTITGIPAERLIATTVTVTGEGLYGKLTAQLKVPSAVLPTVTAGSNALSVQLNAAGAGRNIPAATRYVVELYQGNTLVETKTVSTVQTVAFSGLSSGTAYTLKSYAVSPVGRSDILSQAVMTASGSSGGHTSSGGNSSRPSDPKPPVNDPSTGFTDVKNDVYYADAVKWAVDRGITNGQTTTLFGAEASCTRAQIVTFLWRAAGSPVPQMTKNPFTDLSEDVYYYQAVLWAVEQGITAGTTETTFDPDQTCTRAQAVTFLHRNAGEPEAAGDHGFQDVNGSDYYDNAVQWAKEKSITSGTTETTFSPHARCTRGQIVTFLYRNLGT